MYRFESAWNNPDKQFEKIKHIKNGLGPDFSLWTNMPIALQIFNTYRNRWVSAYWIYKGFENVVPTITFSNAKSYEFCFLGAPRQSVIAVSPLGVINDPEATENFIAGYTRMCEVLDPTLVLCYGKMDKIPLPSGLPPQKIFLNRWEQRKADAEKAKRARFTNIDDTEKLKKAL